MCVCVCVCVCVWLVTFFFLLPFPFISQYWSPCLPGSFVSINGSALDDQFCLPCSANTYSTATNVFSCIPFTVCSPGNFVALLGTIYSNQGCLSCAVNFFSLTSNVLQCSPTTSCTPAFYISTKATLAQDNVCSPCPTGTFSSVANTFVCPNYTICSNSQFEVSNISPISDRVCANTTTCLPTQYLSLPSTPLTDNTCTLRISCYSVFQYLSDPGNATTNGICSDLTRCTINQHESAAPTATSNRICLDSYTITLLFDINYLDFFTPHQIKVSTNAANASFTNVSSTNHTSENGTSTITVTLPPVLNATQLALDLMVQIESLVFTANSTNLPSGTILITSSSFLQSSSGSVSVIVTVSNLDVANYVLGLGTNGTIMLLNISGSVCNKGFYETAVADVVTNRPALCAPYTICLNGEYVVRNESTVYDRFCSLCTEGSYSVSTNANTWYIFV